MSERTEPKPAPGSRRGRIIEYCESRPHAIAVKQELDYHTLTADEAPQLRSLATHHFLRASEEFRGMISASQQPGNNLVQVIRSRPDIWSSISDRIRRGYLFKFCASEVSKPQVASSLSLDQVKWEESSRAAASTMMTGYQAAEADKALFDGKGSLSSCKHDDRQAEQSCLTCMAMSLWSTHQLTAEPGYTEISEMVE